MVISMAVSFGVEGKENLSSFVELDGQAMYRVGVLNNNDIEAISFDVSSLKPAQKGVSPFSVKVVFDELYKFNTEIEVKGYSSSSLSSELFIKKDLVEILPRDKVFSEWMNIEDLFRGLYFLEKLRKSHKNIGSFKIIYSVIMGDSVIHAESRWIDLREFLNSKSATQRF